MSIHVALLRGVNVGGRTQISMGGLREMLTDLGFAEATSLLQSGNLIFRSTKQKGATLERLLETETAKRFDMRTDFFVRTPDEWKLVIEQNPFPDEARRDPGHLLVIFLKEAPAAKEMAALEAAIKGREVVRTRGKHAYIVYPDGVGRSKLTITVIERALGTRGTGRNWNTVMRLDALTTTLGRR